jgi:hypothetical protein
MEPWHIETARAMLQVAELPDGLRDMLDKADERVRAVPDFGGSYESGGLRSRQAVTAVIAAWEASHIVSSRVDDIVMAVFG